MRILRPIILISTFIFFSAALWQGIKKTDLLKLKTIQIMGALPATESRLRKIIKIEPNDSLWEKSVERQAEMAKKDPWVEKAQVRRVFPNTIVIDVKERTPFAVVNEG